MWRGGPSLRIGGDAKAMEGLISHKLVARKYAPDTHPNLREQLQQGVRPVAHAIEIDRFLHRAQICPQIGIFHERLPTKDAFIIA